MSKHFAQTAAALICLLLLVGVITPTALGQGAPSNIVREIVIQGNTHLDDDVIRAAIVKTQVGQPAVDELILDDLRSIYDTGYFQDASATKEQLADGIAVVFYVVENPIVTDIVFRNAESYAMGEFERQMRVQRGKVLNVIDLVEDLRGLHSWFAEKYGRLIHVTDLEADTQGIVVVELTETVLKGVEIVGNEKTKDFVIERELTFEPGDVVDIKEIDRSLRRVLMLGFFDEITREFSQEEDPSETVLTINLKERKTGSATFGVAYGKPDGLVGFVEAADDNFLGRGQRINASLQLGKGMQSYEFGFYEPYIEKGGTSLGFNLYRRNSNIEKKLATTENPDLEPLTGRKSTTGGDITLGRPFTEFTRGRLTLTAENNRYVQNLADDETEPHEDWFKDYATRIIGFGVNTDTTDHPYYPTEGYRNDVYLEMGLKMLGGDSQFAKLRLSHSRYFELFDGGYVFAVRGLGGRTLSGTLEENEEFKIGGANTLRGYSYGANDSLKGDNMLVVNAEFRFPIVERVTGVVFTDWGRAWDNDEKITLSELNNSFGLGVRLDTPLGLLRLDYGFGKDEENKRTGQFYFGVGQTF
ncbi:MAG TPA: BamA/TamA family outer membrane protein [Firmicutes bacterium]|nr:BamA/TamA family outer membrane protein [Bacillota bacterium]